MPKNKDEQYVLELAKRLPGVLARMATPEEDCGYHKSDVIVERGEQTYYLQVSHSPKSKQEVEKLGARGTYNVYTHKFKDMPCTEREILAQIDGILKKH